MSRTSTCRAMTRWPVFSTSCTVSARSSGVAATTPLVATFAQMSEMTTSAPSSASRTAWVRPCPRAAPVMKATRPDKRPMKAAALSIVKPL